MFALIRIGCYRKFVGFGLSCFGFMVFGTLCVLGVVLHWLCGFVTLVTTSLAYG